MKKRGCKMKKIINYAILAIFGISMVGCSLAASKINLKSQSEKTGVFNEVKEEGILEKGFADLIIKTSIKTHVEGYYFLEPEKTFHGQEGYPILINIDGQAMTWNLKGQKEIIPNGKGNHNPEEGEGMRYTLNRRIRLAPGSHRIFFGLPGEKVYKEINLTFGEGSLHVLEFKPLYSTSSGRSTRSFLHGVDDGELFFNGKPTGTSQH
jgi:hypothetical protein